MKAIKGALVLTLISTVVVSSVVFSGCTKTASTTKSATVVKDEKELTKLASVGIQDPYRDSYDIEHVFGSVTNLGKKRLAQVKVELDLKDKAGKPKNSVTVIVKDIEPGVSKSFDAKVGVFKVDEGGTKAEAKITEVSVER